MSKAKSSRKALFKAALAIAEITQDAWAEREGITVSHLSAVLRGQRDSRSLVERVDAFIAQHVGNSAAAVA